VASAETLQTLEDDGVRAAVEQGQADDVEDHEPMGQAAAFGVSSLGKDLLNGLPRDDTLKGTQPLVAGLGAKWRVAALYREPPVGMGLQQPHLGRRLSACRSSGMNRWIYLHSYVALSGIAVKPEAFFLNASGVHLDRKVGFAYFPPPIRNP
jgi:hypothetical protein